jgi:hypothetical protein
LTVQQASASLATLQGFILALLTLLVVGCGSSKWQELLGASDGGSKTKPKNEASLDLGGLTPVGIRLLDQQAVVFILRENPSAPNLALASATRMVINVVGCASGYTVTGHDTSVSGTAVDVYTNDRGCVGQLVEFDYNGQTFTPDNGLPFSGSGSASFSNASDTQTLVIYEFGNFSNPVVPTDVVSFGWAETESGTAYQVFQLQALQGYNGTTRNRPNFRFFTFPVMAQSSAGGSTPDHPQFTVTLECVNTVVGTSPNLACPSSGQNQVMTTMGYRWISTGSAALTYATHASIQSLMRNGGGNVLGSVVAISSASTLPASTGFNGGLQFTLQAVKTTTFRFAILLTSNRARSTTAFGHSALAFTLSGP